jgi:hypothetical protein
MDAIDRPRVVDLRCAPFPSDRRRKIADSIRSSDSMHSIPTTDTTSPSADVWTLWHRTQTEAWPTTAAETCRLLHEVEEAEEVTYDNWDGIDDEVWQVIEGFRALAATLREHAQQCHIAEHGAPKGRLDELRDSIAYRQSRRDRGGHRRARHGVARVARPLAACGARARSSHGSSTRTRGSRRVTARSSGSGDSSGDGSGEPEPPRRPLHDLALAPKVRQP